MSKQTQIPKERGQVDWQKVPVRVSGVPNPEALEKLAEALLEFEYEQQERVFKPFLSAIKAESPIKTLNTDTEFIEK